MTSTSLDLLDATDIASARRRLTGIALHTPLIEAIGAGFWLKLECLQPFGSYKIRGATNAVKAHVERGETLQTIVSASAGNFGQAIAAAARSLGVEAIIHIPDNAAENKVASLRRLGADVRIHPYHEWWSIMENRRTDGPGIFFHPVCDREVMAGAATIAEEIFDDRNDVDRIFIPIGGGGLAAGIAQAAKRRNLGCRIVAVETEVATPLLAAFAAGKPVPIERRQSFIDGMGSSGVLEPMWPLLRRWIDDVVVVSVDAVEAAIRYLVTSHHVVAEGAGAAAVAALLNDPSPRSVAIVSGGNIDTRELARILNP